MGKESRNETRWRYVHVLVSLAPLAYLVGAMAWWRLDFPYLDQWELIPLLEKSCEGTVTLGDLWAQHNEHRLIFPRLIMLVLARLSDWNMAWELATNVVLGVGIFAVLACQLRRTEKAIDGFNGRWLLVLLSLLVFSMSQWENWMLGWQLQELLNVLAVVAGVVLLADAKRGWARFLGALCLGVVATYSFANGMLYWPVGLVTLAIVKPDDPRTHRARLAVWVVVAGVTAASYLYDYHRPEYHPSLWLAFAHPVAFAVYVLKYLGAPMVPFSETGAAVAGFVGLAGLCALPWRLVRTRAVLATALAPYLSLALYAVASAMITGLGRVGFGSTQAMSPRYITFANLVWVADIAFCWALFRGAIDASKAPRRKAAMGVAGLGLALLLALGSAYGTYRWTERYHYRIEARDELLRGDNDDLLRRIHPEPDKIKARRPVLRKYGLTVFRDAPD